MKLGGEALKKKHKKQRSRRPQGGQEHSGQGAGRSWDLPGVPETRGCEGSVGRRPTGTNLETNTRRLRSTDTPWTQGWASKREGTVPETPSGFSSDSLTEVQTGRPGESTDKDLNQNPQDFKDAGSLLAALHGEAARQSRDTCRDSLGF